MELYDEFVKKIEGKPNALPSFEEALGTQETLAAIGYEPVARQRDGARACPVRRSSRAASTASRSPAN